MRITREEAENLINAYCCSDEPRGDAVERAMAYDWNFDPREPHALDAAHRQDEADEVFYGDDWDEQTSVNPAAKG